MHLFPFKNQYDDYDFSLITDTINEYFPISQQKRLTHKTFPSSPGFKKMEKIVTAEFFNKKAYNAKWGKLISRLKKITNKPVTGHPDLAGGGFLGEINLEEDKKPDFIKKKTLCFYISIIGPFFSIQGVDSSFAILEFESRGKDTSKGNFGGPHAITVSPSFEYQDLFKKVEDEVRLFFPGYRFVPYKIGLSTLKNSSIDDDSRNPKTMDTIYEALFGLGAVHECLLAHRGHKTRGDERYGMDDWIKPFTKKEETLIKLIAQHITDSPEDKTIHKVWKLQESKRLDTIKRVGNMMFGMELFDVIDFTDKQKLIMRGGKREAPASIDYNINGDVIEIHPTYSFRIVDLTQTTLTLNLVLDIGDEKASVKGEALEMKFVQMTS